MSFSGVLAEPVVGLGRGLLPALRKSVNLRAVEDSERAEQGHGGRLGVVVADLGSG
jgi:hypothetical protein